MKLSRLVVDWGLYGVFWFSAILAACTVTPATPTAPRPITVPAPVTVPAQCQMNGGLPDPNCTPGRWNPEVTDANLAQTACNPAYNAAHRLSATDAARIKIKVIIRYGLAATEAGARAIEALIELDHLFQLAIGGDGAAGESDELAMLNLWPQWHHLLVNGIDIGSLHKDAFENDAYRHLCVIKDWSLAKAQSVFNQALWAQATPPTLTVSPPMLSAEDLQ